MKIFDITANNIRIIHKCADCSFFVTCKRKGEVNANSIACEKFI